MSAELYDPVANPYAPGAGTPPPELVGRDDVLSDADVQLRRVLIGRSSQHFQLTGLRGVGKTVLLGELSALGERAGFRVIRLEAVGGDDTIVSFLRQTRLTLDGLDPRPRVERALRSVEAVMVTLGGVGLQLRTKDPRPDRKALADVVVDLAAATGEQDLGILLAVDEAQMLDRGDLRRLLAGVHRCGQDALPLWTDRKSVV